MIDTNDHKIYLTPSEAYDLVVAALDVVADMSPGVYRRIRKEGSFSSRPGIAPMRLLALADALNAIRPGIVERVIYPPGSPAQVDIPTLLPEVRTKGAGPVKVHYLWAKHDGREYIAPLGSDAHLGPVWIDITDDPGPLERL
jgi:hypothetical protein